MKKSSIIFIAIVIISMVITGSFFWINTVNKNKNVFTHDGYIISKNDSNDINNATSRYYFSNDTSYKNTVDNKITFKDSENKDVKVDKASFLHYTNGSLGVLTKSVILDFSSVLNDSIVYYNFHENQILNKENGYYTINNVDKVLKFENFIVKISSNKYLIAGKNMTLNVDGTQREIKDDYIELSYENGEIIRIENQEFAIQSVAQQMYIHVTDNIKLDFKEKTIYVKEEAKLDLSKITIDSSDNIDIKEPKTTTTIPTTSKIENQNENSGIKNTTSPISGLENGNINNGLNDNEEEVEENTKVDDPVFNVYDMKVTSNKLKTTIKIEDNYSMLSSSPTIKIIEVNTGKVVYQNEQELLVYDFEVEVENLKPDTNYIFTINAEYIRKNVTYKKDFVQKTFRTESLGISLEKDYFTTDVLAFYFLVSDYSRIKQVVASIYNDKNELIKTKEVYFDYVYEGKVYFSFDGLKSNTNYVLKITDFYYDNYIISDNFNIEEKIRTLKTKPVIGNPTFTINKKKSSFTIDTDFIIDKDNGISSYKYEIYDARENVGITPIKVITKNNNVSVDVPVDGTTIERGVPYVFKLVAEFNDNEKIVEYQSSYSSIMMLDGLAFPSVRFAKKEVTFEKIEGTIIIEDDYETIDLDVYNGIKVVYTDSVGVSNSFFTGGSLEIPFSQNNLRANETYTISIFANVNLQDGNPVVENCLVGKVTVKTEPTKPFDVVSDTSNKNVLLPFSIKTQLSAKEGQDNTLEADTLTGITFNLYSGMTNNGTLVKSITKIDRDQSSYSSTLKSSYYDNSFDITPEFFGLSNSDMTSEYYTIEIVNAYDYTTYKNNIPLENNVITVKSKGNIPDLPQDFENAIEVNTIYNKDAGEKYDSALNPITIVGYKVKADYNNQAKYAKSITYTLYKDDGTKVDEQTIKVTPDGEIEYAYFYLENGTSYGTIDKDFRRGNGYYFTYIATLNVDGEEITYPSSDVILKSKTVVPTKQSASIKLFPSTSDDKSFTWKYTLSDVDNALLSKSIYYELDGNKKSLNISNTETYNDLILDLSSSGNLRMYVNEALSKKGDNTTPRTLINQYFDSTYILEEVKYRATIDSNRVMIAIVDYDPVNSKYQRLAGLKVTFKTEDDSITIDNLKIENGISIVDLAEIESLLGKEIEVLVYAYYDSGITGFETNGERFALQELKNDNYNGDYYSITNDGNFLLKNNATLSMFKKQFSFDKLNLTSFINNKNKNLNILINEKGVSYNYEYMLLKLLNNTKLTADDNYDKIIFDKIIPGISLRDANKKLNIAAGITSADVKINFYGSKSTVKDNKLKLKLYELEEDYKTGSLKEEKEVSISDLNNIITFDNLLPNSNYGLYVYADVYNGTDYEEVCLYDVDTKSNSERYDFITLSGIGISDAKITLKSSDYENKFLRLTYNAEKTLGYDAIIYTIYKKADDGTLRVIDKIVDEEPGNIYKSAITKDFEALPGGSFTAGNTYQIAITPVCYVMVDGINKMIELEKATTSYEFYQLKSANFIISYSYANSYEDIVFKINVRDNDGVVVNNSYTIRIVDENGNDVTPSNYVDYVFDTKTINQFVTLSGYNKSEKYMLIINYDADYLNTNTDFQKASRVYQTRSLSGDIDIGSVYVSTNLEDATKANLVFYDSNNLDGINKIRYSIYNLTGYAYDGMYDFIPKLVNSDQGSYYTYTIPTSFQENGLYYIQIQFIDSLGNIIQEKTLEYNYIK